MDNGVVKALANWNKALNVAKAEGGKKAKFPKPKEDPATLLTKSSELFKKIEEQRKTMLASVKQYQETMADLEAACDDYNKVLAKDEFGLKKADPDDEKSINKIRYNLDKVLTDIGLGTKGARKEAANLRDPLENADIGTL